MLADVQSSYGLARPFQGAGNFQTEHQRTIVRQVCAAVQTGRLVVVSGLVGSGKTHLLRRIEDELARAARVAVAKSLALDKRRTSLPSLIEALFYDLSPGDRAQVKIPKQAERRERDPSRPDEKGQAVDEAHDLHHKTLTGLKRLIEVVADAGCCCRSSWSDIPGCETTCAVRRWREIGYRTTTFDYEGIGSEQRRDYVAWLLGACAAEGVKIGDLMDEDAIDLIAERLRTPLQVEMHLTLALEQGFRLGTKPVTAEIVEQVLSRAIDDLEPTLTRNGYDAGSLASQLNARPSDIRAFLAGTLDPEHTHELTEQLRQASVPL